MRNRSRTEYSMLNIAAGLGGYALSVILSLINRMVFTRCLPPAYLGISGLFSNILSMLSLTELGVSGAIVYALYKPLAQNDEEKIASLVQLFGKAYRTIGLVIGGLGLCVLPFLDFLIGEQPDISESIHLIYVFFLFNTASSYFFTYRSTLLVAAQKLYLVTGLNYLILCVQEVLQAVFLFLTGNYIGYLLIQSGFYLLYYVWISRIAVKQYPYIRGKDIKPLGAEEKKSIFKDVRDLMLYKVSGVLVNGTDNIIITFFNGLATTGLASNYTLLVNTLNSLLNQVFNGITASIGNHNATESDERKYEMYSFLNFVNFWLFGWAALGIHFCSSDLVMLLFGENYVLPDNIPFIMAVSFYLSGITNVIGTYKHTMGLFHYGRFVQLFTALLNVFFSILLGKYWGLFGILLATVIARACTHLWYTPYVVYKYAFKRNPMEYFKGYLKNLIILLIAAGLCEIVVHMVSGPIIIRTMMKIILCSVVTNGVFFVAFAKTPEFIKLKQYLASLSRRIRR